MILIEEVLLTVLHFHGDSRGQGLQTRVMGPFYCRVCQGKPCKASRGNPTSQHTPLNGPQSLASAFLNGQACDVLSIIIVPSLPPMQKFSVPFLSEANNWCLSWPTICRLLQYVCALCVGTSSAEMPSFRNQMYFRKAIWSLGTRDAK